MQPVTDRVGCSLKMFENTKKLRIDGVITVFTRKPLIFKQVIFEIYGTAECNFPLEKLKFKFPLFYSKKRKMHGKQQFYFVRRLVERISYHSNEPENSTTYSFNLGWPNRLPQTWEGDFGSIKYVGKIILICDEVVHVHVQDLIFGPNRKLIFEPNLGLEAKQSTKRKFTFGKNGSITVSLWVPLCGIGVGQSLPTVCSINNESKLFFSGLVFVLTRIDKYRSVHPFVEVKEVRTDVCRVARMVHILSGKYVYYAALKTDDNVIPTNQFYKCEAVQVIYELWVSVQGNFSPLKGFGNPNVDTPGIPIIIGTEPLINYNSDAITYDILKRIYYSPPPKDHIPHARMSDDSSKTDEIEDEQTIINLTRQLEENEKAITEMIDDNSEEDENFF